MNNAMFGYMMLGVWEILIILLVLLVMAGLVVGGIMLAIWLARRGKPSAPTGSPPTGGEQPPATPRNCPRCGSTLPADAPQGLCPRCVLGVGLATHTETGGESGSHGTKVLQAPPPPAEIAKHFPQLEILECLGRGGMGVVYKARQPKLNRLVALKVLAPEKGGDPKFAERFLREAQALARLSHPNIVTVHDFGEVEGLYYLLMEYVDGMTLRQLLQGQRLAPEEALSIVPKICEALQFAHELGVVHRDIKPENVLLDRQGRVKIADFGIAKIVAADQPRQAITQDQVIGTPHYMAPEQVERPQLVDHRADIYSLGVVFYEMLTGELPLGKFQPPSKKVQVDVRLDEVVLHALEKEPERRYQKASDVKTAVETIASTPRTAARGVTPAMIGRYRRHLWVKAACFFFSAVCFLVATVSFTASDNTLAALLSTVAVVSFGIAGYRHLSAAQQVDARTILPEDNRQHESRTGMPEVGSQSVREHQSRPGDSGSAPPIHRGTCYFSTPERMRHCFPSAAAQIFICRGELRLEADALTFLTTWRTRLVIPLGEIEDLSVGQFQMWTTPWVMQYERLNYLAVTYRKDGRSVTVHLTPVPEGATSGRQINEHIGSWFEAIQKAVAAQRGAAPRVTEPGALTISAEPAWNRKGVPLFIALLVAFGLIVWRFRSVFGPAPEPVGIVVFGIMWLLLGGLIWFSVGFLRANSALKRGDLDAVTSDEPPEELRLESAGKTASTPESFWITAARWTARVLGTLLLAIYGLFVFGEGLPPIGSQPGGVQLSFVAVGLMLLGFVVGWKREGTAALLIGSGWALWHIAEGRIGLNAFQTPVPVAVLYGLCWWATQGRRTYVVLLAGAVLLTALTVGLLLCPSSVFVRGMIVDAETGKPIPNAELTLERWPGGAVGKEWRPNARSGKDGRFALYVGWYGEEKRVSIAAPGFATLTTSLGPRALGQRDVSRTYHLWPASTSQGQRISPVVERVMCSVATQRPIKAEDLDGGREIEVPAEMEKAGEAQFFHWLAAQGADLLAFGHKRSWDLWASPKLASVPAATWEQPITADLLSALKSGPVGLQRVEPDAKEGFISYRLETNAVFPLTFAFQTQAGALGVLQVTGLTESPQGVKIRYQLVQTAGQSPQLDALSEADRTRAVALFKDIEDFSHEFNAAFDARNIRAAQACTRRVLTLLTNFNTVVRGTDYEFPAPIFDDMAKVRQALDRGDWDQARQLVQSNVVHYNEEYFYQFQRIANRVKEWALSPRHAATNSFGPVIERVVNDDTAGTNFLIDLDTGKLFTPPANLKPGDGTGNAKEWYVRNGIDAMGNSRTGIEGLVGVDVFALQAPGDRWNDSITPPEWEALQSASPKWRVPAMTGAGTLPATYLFKTREGGIGILQILGPNTDPPGMRIRYKLVQSAERTLAASSGESEAARRKSVRLVVDKEAMTFEGQPTTWETLSALLERVTDRTSTVLECAVTSDQITVQQQNEWFAKCVGLARTHGFEYASFIGIHALGSKGTHGAGAISAGSPSGYVTAALAGMDLVAEKIKEAAARGGLGELADVFNHFNELCDQLQGKNQNRATGPQDWGIADVGKFRAITNVISSLEDAAERMRDVAQSTRRSKAEREQVLGESAREFLSKYAEFKALVSTASQAAISPIARPEVGTFQVTLANGVSVEVVAVTRNPLANKLWWKPDGTPLPQPPGARVIFQPAGMWTEKDLGEEEHAVLVRCDLSTGADDRHWQYKVEHKPKAEHLGRLEVQQGNRLQQVTEELERLARQVVGGAGGPKVSSQIVGYAEVLRFPAGTKEVSLQCASAAGPWEPVAVFDGKRTKLMIEGARVLCTYLRQDPNGKCLDVTHDVDRDRYALRVLGVFKDGKRQELAFHSGVLSGRETQGFVVLEPGQRVEDVAEFVLERTPWVRGEVSGIALTPVGTNPVHR